MRTHTHTFKTYPYRFDPDTAVPSRRDGQVEAFSACLAAQATLEQSLLGTMRGAGDEVNGRMLFASVGLYLEINNVNCF